MGGLSRIGGHHASARAAMAPTRPIYVGDRHFLLRGGRLSPFRSFFVFSNLWRRLRRWRVRNPNG